LEERICRLRKASLDAVPAVSAERAELLTDFYKNIRPDEYSIPVARAFAFRHVLEGKALFIGNDELIVGERGPEPKATSTYPEICIHSIEDLDILDSREKISFRVSDETRKSYLRNIIPFWQGKSMRERIFREMDSEWIDAYEAGIFTEFMEQRAPGHTVLDDKIYRNGFEDFIRTIETRLRSLDTSVGPEAAGEREELEGMLIAAEAIIIYARRYAQYARELAGKETNPVRKRELQEIADICEKVPAKAPGTFREALQYYWFVHLGVITELNTWDSFNPGRLDQHLYPFYEKELAAGTLTRERAGELLQAFWIKFNNQPAPPKVGVTAAESGTYTDFCLINLGGVTEEGKDGVNDLTYLILEVIQEMRLLQPSSMIQVSRENPDRFIEKALEIIRTGFGQPSIFNTDAIVQELVRQGKSLVDARRGGASGCVEAGAFGREAYILTGYFNLPKVLEITLNNGLDPRTGKIIGLPTGEPESWKSYNEMFEAYEKQLNHFLDIKIKGSLKIEQMWARYLPAPFLSILIDDCIENGKDYNAGGARYNSSYIQGVGLGSITDCLSSMKYHVFHNRSVSMKEMLGALKADFQGYDELLETVLTETPRYGNDDDFADALLTEIFEAYFEGIDGRPNTRGGHFRVNLLPTTCHVYFGSVIGATPDGRRAGVPLSEGISPVQGADRLGPTAVLKSASKIDHLRTGGTLLNQKFTPQFMNNAKGLKSILHLIRSYFSMDGHHIQFNVVEAETLKEAQVQPEKHTDLVVRVAGYSDYFVDLGRSLQDEIIRRTEHHGC